MAIDDHERAEVQKQNERIAALRESIRLSFPDEPYAGKITSNDHNLDDPELDEDKDLYLALRGRRWTEVPDNLICNLPDGYVLLTDQAFAAFVPAWLMYSLGDMNAENEVRNFVVHAFSTTMRQFRALNPEQRHAVRATLLELSEWGTPAPVRKLAVEAVALIDRGRY